MNQDLKSIEEWLNTLPRIPRKRAIFNLDKRPIVKDKIVPDLATAISSAFDFGTSKEGREYWNQILYKAMEGEI